MQKFLSNGGLSKMLWIILTFIVGLGAMFIAGVEILSGQPINSYIANILLVILAHAFTIGGSVNTSSQLESNSSNIAKVAADTTLAAKTPSP